MVGNLQAPPGRARAPQIREGRESSGLGLILLAILLTTEQNPLRTQIRWLRNEQVLVHEQVEYAL